MVSLVDLLPCKEVIQVLLLLALLHSCICAPSNPMRCKPTLSVLRTLKRLAWLVAAVESVLIVASRKHYTVDIIIAWWGVPHNP